MFNLWRPVFLAMSLVPNVDGRSLITGPKDLLTRDGDVMHFGSLLENGVQKESMASLQDSACK